MNPYSGGSLAAIRHVVNSDSRMPPKKRLAPLATYGKGRCRYCDKVFTKTKPNKKFCTDQHRINYNNAGLALGPLREKLPKWIAKEVTKQLAELWDTRLAPIALEAERVNKLIAARHDDKSPV